MIFTFNSEGNYHEQFNDYVDELDAYISLCKETPPIEQRLETVNNLIESYFNAVGKRPPDAKIHLLGKYIDIDYYRDRTPRKDKGLEYNYHTDIQQFNRKRHETGDHLTDKYDSEGVNKSLPTRGQRRKDREDSGEDSLTRSIPDSYGHTTAYE